MMIVTRTVRAAFSCLVLTGCGGGGGGDPLGEQLRADIKRAEADSPYDFRQGFVSRWEYNGKPMFASCIELGFKSFRNGKIYPHGGPNVSIGHGDDFREQSEWREYCSNPMTGADGKPVAKGGTAG